MKNRVKCVSIAAVLFLLSAVSEAKIKSQAICSSGNDVVEIQTYSLMGKAMLYFQTKKVSNYSVAVVSENEFYDESNKQTRAYVEFDNLGKINFFNLVLDGNPYEYMMFTRPTSHKILLFISSDKLQEILGVTEQEFECELK